MSGCTRGDRADDRWQLYTDEGLDPGGSQVLLVLGGDRRLCLLLVPCVGITEVGDPKPQTNSVAVLHRSGLTMWWTTGFRPFHVSGTPARPNPPVLDPHELPPVLRFRDTVDPLPTTPTSSSATLTRVCPVSQSGMTRVI